MSTSPLSNLASGKFGSSKSDKRKIYTPRRLRAGRTLEIFDNEEYVRKDN